MPTTATAKNILLGFGLGWSNVTIGTRDEVKGKLMAALGITTRAAFNNYKSGRQRVTFDQAEEIEKIFKAYGIRKIWGRFAEQTSGGCNVR